MSFRVPLRNLLVMSQVKLTVELNVALSNAGLFDQSLQILFNFCGYELIYSRQVLSKYDAEIRAVNDQPSYI